jgi:sulfur carrier protein ThiS
MRIQVRTVGTLRALEKGSRAEIQEVPWGGSVATVMEKLQIQDWEVGFIKINGQIAGRDSILVEGDELTLIAPLVGG